MTKNVKSKKLIAAGLLSAAVLCFGGAQVVNTVSNNNDGTAIVRAYAETEYEVFQANIAILDSIDIDEVIAEGAARQGDYNAYVTAYLNAADVYGWVASQATDEEKATYQAASAKVGDVADAFNYMSTTLTAKLADRLYWSDKAKYDAVITSIEDGLDPSFLGALARHYIQNVYVGYADTKDAADTEFARLDAAIDDAITAIAAIADVGTFKSEAAINAATEKIEAIYGIEYDLLPDSEKAVFGTYVVNYADYEDAVEQLNAITEEIEMMYGDVTANNTYYTFKDYIEDKYVVYEGAYNGMLTELYNTLNDILLQKANVESAIKVVEYLDPVMAVDPRPYEYTDAYIDDVVQARTLYDELPEDLKDSGEVAHEHVLFVAEDLIAADRLTVDNLIAATLALIDLYNDGDAAFSSAVNNAASARAGLYWAKQLDEFDTAVVDPAFEGKDNCKALLTLMQTKRATLMATVKPVTDAITAIGALELTNVGIADRITTARALYDALETELERNSVFNYDTLVAAEEWLAEETAAITEWAAAVDAIDAIVTVEDLEALAAVEDTYTAFDATTKTFIHDNAATYNEAKYLDLITERIDLLNDVDAIATAMEVLPTDLATICADPVVFETDLLDVELSFLALDESIQALFFTEEGAEYELQYANYVEAYGLYENVVQLVCKIIALGDDGLGGDDPAMVTMSEYEGILADLEEYEALADEYKDVINNQGAETIGGVDYESYKDRLDTAYVVIELKKAARDAWIESVYALVGDIAKEDWEDELYNVDLDALDAVVDVRTVFTEDGDAEYLAEATDDMHVISNIAIQRIDDIIDDINNLPAALTEADIPTLKEIKATYEKLHATQQDEVYNYGDFLIKYNTYVTSSSFDELIETLYENVVTEGDFTKQVPINVALLREIYKNLTPAAQAMVTKMDKLDEIEAAYEAYDGIILDLTSVNAAVRELIQVNAAAIAENVTAIAENAASIEAAQTDIGTLFEVIGNVDTEGTIIYTIAQIEAAIENIEAVIGDATEFEGTILGEIANINGVLASLVEGLALTNIDVAEIQLAIAEYDDDEELVGGILFDLEQLADAIETAVAELNNAITAAVNAAKAELNTAITNAVNAAKQELTTALNTAVSNLNNAINAAKEEAATNLNTVKEELENKINTNKQDLDQKITNLNNKIQELDQKTGEDVSALSKRVKTLEIESYILIAAVVLLAGVDVVFLILRKKA